MVVSKGKCLPMIMILAQWGTEDMVEGFIIMEWFSGVVLEWYGF